MVSTTGISSVITLKRVPGIFTYFQYDSPLPELGTRIRVTSSNPYRTEPVEGTFAGLLNRKFFLLVRPTPDTQVEFDPCIDPKVTMEVLD